MLKEEKESTDGASTLSAAAPERGRVVFMLTQSHIDETEVGKPGPPTRHRPVTTDGAELRNSRAAGRGARVRLQRTIVA